MTQDFVEQASITDVPLRIALVGVVLVVIGLVLWGMWRGWRNRQARQADIPEPAEVAAPGDAFTIRVPGQFIGSSRHGDWLDRIAVHDLGIPSRASACVGPSGLWFDRVGARSVFVPRADVRDVRIDRGIAGRVRERDGLVVVTWALGDATIDSGFRADDHREQEALLDGCMALLADA